MILAIFFSPVTELKSKNKFFEAVGFIGF